MNYSELNVCKAKFSKHVSGVIRGSDPLNVLIDGDSFNECSDELDFSFIFAPFTKDNLAIALCHYIPIKLEDCRWRK